jgi:hypothetical protein
MHRKILILVVFLLALSGCKKNTELVDPYKMSNQIIDTMNSKTEQGIYEINSSKKQLIIYRGVDKGIQKMSYSINNNVLTILFETEELNQPQDYVYKINSNAQIDTIKISIDGKDEAFNTIFAQEY